VSDGFSLAAYAVVQDGQRRVLLARRRDGDEWVLPGGSVEPDEAPWESVAREVKEETKMEVADLTLVGVYAKPSENDVVFLFAADVVAGAPSASDEMDRVAFFDPSAPPQNLARRHAERIRDALDSGRSVFLRVQPAEGPDPPPGVR
jgi:8-oxo-dGTP pyrophosphatase MutT (NUDIX family)